MYKETAKQMNNQRNPPNSIFRTCGN